jgi:hypothetical protein
MRNDAPQKHIDYQDLVKNDRYQIFLFVCPSTLPFSFAAHPWFVCNNKGKISRWEVFFRKHKHLIQHGHLTINFFTPFRGIEVIPYVKRYHWNVKLLGLIEGGEDSAAHKMVEFIENSKNTYPYCHKYSITGPNCNTYIQWVLYHFPEFRVPLPWNAFGKGYRATNRDHNPPTDNTLINLSL